MGALRLRRARPAGLSLQASADAFGVSRGATHRTLAGGANPVELAMKNLSTNHPLPGVLFVAAAVACFAALDTTTQLISGAVPLVMAVWFRYVFQAVGTAAVLIPRRGASLLHTCHPWLQLLRGALLLTSSMLSYLSLRYTPVGEFTAVIMLTPLVVTVLAATSLGERVSALRWVLVFGGFLGAMIVIRPGRDMFEWSGLLPLLLVGVLGAFQALTGHLARLEDAGTTHFYTGLVGALACSAALPFFWAPLTAPLWWALLWMGVFGSVGHLLLIFGYARAPVATLTPYLYLQVVFAALGGWLVFEHVPDMWALIGIVTISLCGAGGTWLSSRERRRQAAHRPSYMPPEAEGI